MKLLLVANDERMKETLTGYTDIHGGSIIHYRLPLKSMDNFDEIEPEIVLFSTIDFPRHWKLAAQSLRDKWNRRKALFILLTEKDFPAEEADKAAYLGVNALIEADELSRDNYKRLHSLMTRYRLSPEKADGPVFHTLKTPCPLMFMNPVNLQFISGQVERELLNRILFFPSEPAAIVDLKAGTILRNCSMERKGQIETFDSVIRKGGKFLELEILQVKEMKGIA